MATRAAQVAFPQRGIIKVVWSGLLNGDVGDLQDISRFPDRSVQIKGTFGVGGTVSVEGSLDGGTTFAILNDTRGEGNALTFTAAKLVAILENAPLRPNVTAGDGTTSLTVTVWGSSSR